jgi:hypothetical protein
MNRSVILVALYFFLATAEYAIAPAYAEEATTTASQLNYELDLNDSIDEALIVFVIEPRTLGKVRLTVYPVNHDLLEAFAHENGFAVNTFRESRQDKDLNVRSLIAVTRFPDSLKRKQAFSVTISETASLFWQIPDSQTVKRRLQKLASTFEGQNGFEILNVESMLSTTLKRAIAHSHWRKVPTRFRPDQANPDGTKIDLSSFPASLINSSSH